MTTTRKNWKSKVARDADELADLLDLSQVEAQLMKTKAEISCSMTVDFWFKVALNHSKSRNLDWFIQCISRRISIGIEELANLG